MDKSQFEKLIERYRNGIATDHERALFENLYDRLIQSRQQADAPPDYQAIKATLDRRLAGYRRKPNLARRWPYAAAVAFLFAVAGLILGINYQTGGPQSSAARLVETAILPGGNRATLTLADGTIVALNSDQEGVMISDGITYLDGSAVLDETERLNDATQTLVLTTPKGGMYSVTLSDGSRIWLNAASTLRYPVRFSGENREVILEGEAYFEIQKLERPEPFENSQQIAFKVQAAGQTIEVLGTEFNISAYGEEAETRTTLVEGKVKVTTDGKADYMLTPGQQATTHGTHTDVKSVNVDQYVAWRDGYFHFDGEGIRSVMRKIARWYDVEVEFHGSVTDQRFSGTMSRFEDVEQVLSKLSLTEEVHFSIEGRKIIVKP